MQESNNAIESEKAFFNSLVDVSGDFNPFKEQGWKTLSLCFQRAASQSSIALKPFKRLLDVGCGTGMSKQIFEGFFEEYTGLDLSESAIGRAKHLHPNHSWQIGNACRLPFDNESFDAVSFSSVLHHIPDFGPAVSESFRVLKPGGMVFAFDPNVLHPAMALLRHPQSPFYLSAGVSPNERPLLPSALKRTFLKTGFCDIQQWCQSNLPYRKVAPRGVNLFLSVYNVADFIWQNVGLGKSFGTFVITSGRKAPSYGEHNPES